VTPRSASAWAMAQPMIPVPTMTASAVCFTRVDPSSLSVAIHAQLRLPMAESMTYRSPTRSIAGLVQSSEERSWTRGVF
jgi:hypothetical protein